MRLALLSSVSFLFLAVAPVFIPTDARAGFEFVPPAAAPKPAAATSSAAAMPSVDNAPVTAETIPAAPMDARTDKMPTLSAETMPVENKSVADEPMVLGKKAIPLTPVVKNSDALILDDMPTADASAPSSAAASNSAPMALATPAKTANASDVMWDHAPSAMQNEELPPALPMEDMAAASPPKIATADIDDGLPVQGFGRQVPLALALQQIVPPNYRYSFDTGVDPGQRVSWTGGKSWKAIIMDLARNNNLNVDIVTNVVAFHRRTPMDIVSNSANVDMSQDTVQGMPLTPVPTPHETVNDPVVLPPISTDDMPLTNNAGHAASADPYMEDDSSSAATMPMDDSAAASMSKKKQDMTGKQAKATTPNNQEKQAKFDDMLDNDRPAGNLVRDKKIITVSEPTIEETAANNAMLNAAADDMPAAKPTERKMIATASADDAAMAAPMNIVPPASGKEAPPAMPSPILDNAGPAETKSSAAMPVKDEWMKPLPADGIKDAPEMSARASMTAADLTTSQEWEGYKNQTLRETLTAWSQHAGVSVVWSSEYDYPLQTDVRVAANYGDAVRTLLAGFSKAQPRPIGRLFKNDKVGAQPVLVVETQRLTN